MPTNIKLKNSVTTTAAPSTLVQGEVAVNIIDKKVWVGDATSVPVQIVGAGATVSGTTATLSALTSGRVTYAGTAGLLQDSANLTFDGSTLTTLNTAYTGTLTGGTGVVNLGSGQFYKDASGNVGIGTSSPSDKVTIVGTLGIVTATTATAINSNNASNTGFVLKYASALTSLGNNFNQPLAFLTNDTERMRIDSAGNVGIGVTPSVRLQISGPDGNALLQINQTTNSNRLQIENNSAAYSYYHEGNIPVRFFTNATERMRIDGGGNVLVGNTTAFGKVAIANSDSLPSLAIEYSGTTAFQIEAIATSASYVGPGIRARNQNIAVGTGYFAFSYYNDNLGNYAFRVMGNGNVQNTNNSYGAISDIKLKENIVDATPKLEDLCKVKVRQYNFKSDPNHKQIGIVAQELEEVFAGLVEETQDRDVDGNDLGTTTKQVKYSVFVPMLIKAMQEQQTLIQNLTTRLNALEGK